MLYPYISINITEEYYCGRRINGWTMVQSFIILGSPSIHFSYQKVNSGSINSAECVSQAFQLAVTFAIRGTLAPECRVAKLKGGLVLKPIPYMGYSDIANGQLLLHGLGFSIVKCILILLNRFFHDLKSNLEIAR